MVDGTENPRILSVTLLEDSKREPIVFGNFHPKGSLIYFVESCGVDCTVLITRDYNSFKDHEGGNPFETSTDKHIDPFPNPFPTLSEPELIIGTETIPPSFKRTSTEFSTEQHIDPYPGYSTETLLVKTDEFPALFNERLDIDVSETRQCLQVGKFRGVSKVDF